MERSGAPALLSLGSNLGDRLLNLRRAIAGLRKRTRLVRISSIYETEPIDAPPGSSPFLNAAALVLHHGGAEQLLAQTMALERELGRVRSERNGPRVIDIDLVLYDAAMRGTQALTLPHPRYRQREFVLAPLREIAAWWFDPIVRAPVGALRGYGQVARIGSLLARQR
jgi:2-amino-4-hydroxy-6-hydroxymethyldihydropteridine diphosphokinase